MKRSAFLIVLCALLMVCSCAAAARGFPGGGMSFGGGQVEVESEEEMLERLLEEQKQDWKDKHKSEFPPKEKFYADNTVCSFGPQFREVSRRLTDAWYMFTPVDLSQDGVQTFDLIAGNMYVIGKVTITVNDGKFEVDYKYADTGIQSGREFFTFFADYESVTSDALEQFDKRFLYGKAYSIEEKLGGDTDVLLYVCNTATFRKTTRGIYRYYETNDERTEMREAMLQMIGR